jgi:TRAP transporter TAXI family solute receptor
VRRLALALLSVLVLHDAPAAAQEAGAQDADAQGTLEVGKTGFDVKRPVLASACEHGCPWGELGDFVVEAMQPLGYEVILCRNCNKDQGPPIVAQASYPPPIGFLDTFVGTTTRVDAPVDFGITEGGLLAWAYDGRYNYAQSGPLQNLRLIAKIEDPTYLMVAVKADSGITDLSQIAQRQMAVTILGGDSPIAKPVLDHYGLTPSAVMSWGGTIANAIVNGQSDDPAFDVIVNELASPANNPESAFWTKVSQKHDLRFLDVPEQVLDQLARDPTLGLTRVTAKWGLLRGVDRAIPTVARSGEAVFGRDDTPEQAAYDVAKAIDRHRDALKWYIRPYSYDSRTVWTELDVPIHPGAARYYREVGYMPGATTGNCDGGIAAAPSSETVRGGCAIAGVRVENRGACPLIALLAGFAAWRRRKEGCAISEGDAR